MCRRSSALWRGAFFVALFASACFAPCQILQMIELNTPADRGARQAKDRGAHSRRNSGRTRSLSPLVHRRLCVPGIHRISGKGNRCAAWVDRGCTSSDPANTIGELTVFPGSYPVRMTTVRAIFMDLADTLGAQGFRWVFLIHNHAAP